MIIFDHQTTELRKQGKRSLSQPLPPGQYVLSQFTSYGLSWTRTLQVSLRNSFRDLNIPSGMMHFLVTKQGPYFNQNPCNFLLLYSLWIEETCQIFIRTCLYIEVGCCYTFSPSPFLAALSFYPILRVST